MLPADNICPPTYNLVKKVVNVKDVSEYEYHVCKCGAFKKIRKEQWMDYSDEQCPRCN